MDNRYQCPKLALLLRVRAGVYSTGIVCVNLKQRDKKLMTLSKVTKTKRGAYKLEPTKATKFLVCSVGISRWLALRQWLNTRKVWSSGKRCGVSQSYYQTCMVCIRKTKPEFMVGASPFKICFKHKKSHLVYFLSTCCICSWYLVLSPPAWLEFSIYRSKPRTIKSQVILYVVANKLKACCFGWFSLTRPRKVIGWTLPEPSSRIAISHQSDSFTIVAWKRLSYPLPTAVRSFFQQKSTTW